MHIPDGFLSTPVAIVGWILALAAIALALRNTRDQLGERQAPLMGVLAAAVFAGTDGVDDARCEDDPHAARATAPATSMIGAMRM